MDSFSRKGLDFEMDQEAFQQGRVVLKGRIEVEGEPQPVLLEVAYPDMYPWTRFVVAAPDLDLSRHQHPSGKTLCVFPRGSANWRRTFLAGDIIDERVPELIQAVRQGGEVLKELEDPQGEPFTDYYEYHPLGAILVPNEITDATKGLDGGQITIRLAPSLDWLEIVGGFSSDELPGGTGLVVSARRGQQRLASTDEALSKAFGGSPFFAEWVRVPEPPPTDHAAFVREVARLHPHIVPEKHQRWFGRKSGIAVVGVVFPEEVRQGEKSDSWVFIVYGKEAPGKVRRKRGHPPPKSQEVHFTLVRGMRCDETQLQERIPELVDLRSKSVAIIGIGTLGAPIAVDLARALVRTIIVIDHDFADAGASVRWLGGFTAAGQLKVNWLAKRIRFDYPYTEIRPKPWAIGNANGEGTGDRLLLESELTSVDLVIDATAEDNVTGALADFARTAGKPLIALWSIEGVGGVVARIVPGETGCFHCLELALSPDFGTIPLPEPAGMTSVQPRGCADPTFTGSAPDLLPLTDHASRMAFGELTRGIDGGYPRYRNDIHVLFLRRRDGSLYDPVRWESHSLPVHPACPLHAD